MFLSVIIFALFDFTLETEFIEAAKNGNFSEVEKMITAKADVNQIDTDGRTALFHSVGSADLEVVTLLINAKAMRKWNALVKLMNLL